MRHTAKRRKKSFADFTFDLFVCLFCIIFMAIILYPLILLSLRP